MFSFASCLTWSETRTQDLEKESKKMNKEKFEETQKILHGALNTLGNAYLSSVASGNDDLQAMTLNAIDELEKQWRQSCALHNLLFLHEDFIKCCVTFHLGAYLVTFEDGKTLLLQSDYDVASFAVNCGVVVAPKKWTGLPSELPENWQDVVCDILGCPSEYHEQAE